MSANSIVQSTKDLLSNHHPRRRKPSPKKKVPNVSPECLRMFQIFNSGLLSRKGISAMKPIERLSCDEEQPVVDLSNADEPGGNSDSPNEASLVANHNEGIKQKECPPLLPIFLSQNKNFFSAERSGRKKTWRAKSRDIVHTSGTWEPPTIFPDPSSRLLDIRHSSLVPSEPPRQNDWPNGKQKLHNSFNNSPRKSKIRNRCKQTAEASNAARVRILKHDSLAKKSSTSKNGKPNDVTPGGKKISSHGHHISKYEDNESCVTSTVHNLGQQFLSSVQENPLINATSNSLKRHEAVPNSLGAPQPTETSAAGKFSSPSKKTLNKCQYLRKMVPGTCDNVDDILKPTNLRSSNLHGGKLSSEVSSQRMHNFTKTIMDNDPGYNRLQNQAQKMSQSVTTITPMFLTTDTKDEAAKAMMDRYASLQWLKTLSGSTASQQQLQDDRSLSEKNEKFTAGTSQCCDSLLGKALDREIDNVAKNLQPQPRGTEVCGLSHFPVSCKSYVEKFNLSPLNVMNGMMKSRAGVRHSQEPQFGKLTTTQEISSSQKNDVIMQAGSLFLKRAVSNTTQKEQGCLKRLLDEPGKNYHIDAESAKKIRKSAENNSEQQEPSKAAKVLNDGSSAGRSMQVENSGDPLEDENSSPPKPTTVIYFKSEPASDDENSDGDGNLRSRLETTPLPIEEDILDREGGLTRDFIKEEHNPEEIISSKEMQKQNENVDVAVRIKEEVVLESEPESPKMASYVNEIFDGNRSPRRSRIRLQTDSGNANDFMVEKTVDLPSPSPVAWEDYQKGAVTAVTPQIKIEPGIENENMVEPTNGDRILSQVTPDISRKSREGDTGLDISIMIKTEIELDNEDESGDMKVQNRGRAVTNLTFGMDSEAESQSMEVSPTDCQGKRDDAREKNGGVSETYLEGGDNLITSHEEKNIGSGMLVDEIYGSGCYIKTEEVSDSNDLMGTVDYNVNDCVTDKFLNNRSQNEIETGLILHSVFESEFEDEFPTPQQSEIEKTDNTQSICGFQNKTKSRRKIKNKGSLINMRENPGTSLILSRLNRETTELKGFSFDACELPKPYVVENSTEPVETSNQQTQTEIISALVCEPLMSYEQLTDEKLLYFTGVNKLKFAVLQGFVFSNYHCVTWKYLSEENQLLLTLFKYKHKVGNDYLSVLFGISESRVSLIISRVTKDFSISVNDETLWSMKKYKGSLSLVIECREFISSSLKAAYPELSLRELSFTNEFNRVKWKL